MIRIIYSIFLIKLFILKRLSSIYKFNLILLLSTTLLVISLINFVYLMIHTYANLAIHIYNC